jgi:outer membrane protein, multidrug efflux system
MQNLLKSTAASLALIALLSGCATTTSFQRPAAALPGQWEGTNTANANSNAGKPVQVGGSWWKQFGNDELNTLMDQALAANHDLAAAVLRIRQARASAGIVSAAQMPSANLSASAGRNHNNQSSVSNEQSQLGLTVAYEVDLWGGNFAQAQAANARVDASEFDRDAVALVLQADVASNYFRTLALKDRMEIARKNLEAARDILRLTELRFSKGATTGLEVSQQRTAVLSNEAQIPQLEQELRSTQTALAVLLGRVPQGFAVQGSTLAGLQLPAVDAGQPASLLARRPDIRRAEAQLEAAHADVDAARAALYPNLKLSASAVAGGMLTSGSSLATSLLASLTQTLFDGGRLRGQVALSQSQREELTEDYLQSVLVSLKEVQDSLGLASAAQARQGLLTEAAKEAREAFRIANVKYQAGSQDMLTLLDSQRTQLQAEDTRIQADLARFDATIDLYKALGGGWSDQQRQPS